MQKTSVQEGGGFAPDYFRGGGGGGRDVLEGGGGLKRGGGVGWDPPPARVPLWSPPKVGRKL